MRHFLSVHACVCVHMRMFSRNICGRGLPTPTPQQIEVHHIEYIIVLILLLNPFSYFPHVLRYWLRWCQIAVFPEDPPALPASPLTQQQGRQQCTLPNSLTTHFPLITLSCIVIYRDCSQVSRSPAQLSPISFLPALNDIPVPLINYKTIILHSLALLPVTSTCSQVASQQTHVFASANSEGYSERD